MKSISSYSILFCLGSLLLACNSSPQSSPTTPLVDTLSVRPQASKPVQKTTFEPLTTQSAIPFLHQYAKENPERRLLISTRLGDIEVELFENTPYHRANFVFLAKQGYFDGTYFYRVVKNFIIQGGNSDGWDTVAKRRTYGAYLLPPDTKKGHLHHRGVLSMPSSEIDNPHKFASPYEFFIVAQKGGAHHLNGSYTAFGKVVKGMEVVDAIANLPTDAKEWPLHNVKMKVSVIE